MIHKFKMFGTNIVVDVNSGAVHVFDDAAYDVLDLYDSLSSEEIIGKLGGRYGCDEVREAISEICELKDKGVLFSENALEGYVPDDRAEPIVKALCLHISHDCNLRCRYCFASAGNFGGERLLMPFEVGKAAIDFVVRKSAGRRNVEVDFFGGEPLMNCDTVKRVVEYARSIEDSCGKKFKFTLTTNGVLLNEKIRDYLNENMHNVVMSLDGRKSVNDRMRTRIDGTGSYDDILPKIVDVAKSRNQDNYYVRGTFTMENLDFANDVLHLADLGFRQVSVEPVVAANGTGYELKEEDLPVLYEQYEKLAAEYVKRMEEGRGFNFFHFMIDLDRGPCAIKRFSGCGSGNEYLAVTPEGDLYPCHQFVGMSEFRIGSVLEGELNTEIMSRFKGSNILTKVKCRECWAKFYCGGGCAANAYQFNGDLNQPYELGCKLEQKRVECALWIKSRL